MKSRTTRPVPALSLTLDRARAHWHRRQGLAEPMAGPLEDVVARTGWPRTLGGVDVYLSMRARVPGLRRADLDAAVEQGRLQVLPAVRGCIYLVPRAQAALALAVAEVPYRKRLESELTRAGATMKEVADAGDAVVAALARGPLSPDALRKALPEGAVRSLGDRGKKVGLTSTLPSALRLLEFAGRVERVLEGGRLDSERYLWRLPRKRSRKDSKIAATAEERAAALALVFHASAGPASVADFAVWSGLTKGAAAAAVAAAGLHPVEVEGYAELAYVVPEDLPELKEKARPSDRIQLLAFEDNHVVLHGGPALLLDARHHGVKVGAWGASQATTLGAARHVSWRTLFVGDRLAGFWELDPDRGEVVHATFDPLKPKQQKAVEAEAARLAPFISDELGHARSFSLDTMDEVKKRAAQIRKLRKL